MDKDRNRTRRASEIGMHSVLQLAFSMQGVLLPIVHDRCRSRAGFLSNKTLSDLQPSHHAIPYPALNLYQPLHLRNAAHSSAHASRSLLCTLSLPPFLSLILSLPSPPPSLHPPMRPFPPSSRVAAVSKPTQDLSILLVAAFFCKRDKRQKQGQGWILRRGPRS